MLSRFRCTTAGGGRAATLVLLAAFDWPSLVMGQVQPGATTPQDVLTYHGNNLRTGWFSAESVLAPANVSATQFGLLATVPLDGRVDAEPLVALQQRITGLGLHDVVYVATENNSVYALDAATGAVLWQRNLGTAVPYQYKNNDDNVYPVIGILGTPTIDRAANAIYLVSDVYTGSVDYFRVHALSLSNGKDIVSPGMIRYVETLSDGSKWLFKPQFQLQRAGLLEANGNIYVTFGSNGDIVPSASRGTILAFDASTLVRQDAAVTDSLSLDTSPFYLSSIWQSGFAPAVDSSGDIFFSTGNSDPSQPTYSASFNRPESVVRMSGQLDAVVDSFTPSNYFSLEGGDTDLGSGGVLLLPDQAGSYPHLAIGGGKDGRAFLLNRDKMGGYTPNGPDDVLQTVTMGGCWCGPAYYVGPDNIPRVVTGGDAGLTSWKLMTSPTIQLVSEASTSRPYVNGLPDNGGVIPVISSNGTVPNTAIIWFVKRPSTSSDQDPGTAVTLLAFAATDLTKPLVAMTAGTWVHAVNSNANIVPTVANGRVYVGSNKQLAIFGLLPASGSGNQPQSFEPDARPVGHPSSASITVAVSAPDAVTCPGESEPASVFGTQIGSSHDFYGTICNTLGTRLTLALRTGKALNIDIAGIASDPPFLLTPGRPVHVEATLEGNGQFHALRMVHSHVMSSTTPADR